MGIDVDDYVRGADNDCWAPGETPKYIFVSFSNGHSDWNCAVTQTVDPERWEHAGVPPALHVRLDIGPFNNKLTVTKDFGNRFLAEALLCAQNFHDLVEDIHAYYFWGTMDAVAAMVGSGYLWSMDGTKYDAVYRGPGLWTFKLCNKKVPSNILVQYEP